MIGKNCWLFVTYRIQCLYDLGQQGIWRYQIIGGLLTIAVGIGLKTMKSSDEAVAAALLLLFCGALLWSIAALAFAAIREEPGATEGGRNALGEAIVGMGFVMREPWYLRYLAARTALLSVEIAAPFYVLYVREKLPVQTGTLGLIIVAAGLAAALSSPSGENLQISPAAGCWSLVD